MKELELKYGCNPNQKPSRIYMEEGELPIKVLNGKPGYINFADAFNGWQLVKELKKATGLPAATSFKTCFTCRCSSWSPLSEVEAKIYWVDDLGELSPSAMHIQEQEVQTECHHMVTLLFLSDVCDVSTAKVIKRIFRWNHCTDMNLKHLKC